METVLYCPGSGEEWELGQVSREDYKDVEQIYVNENNLFARQYDWLYRVLCQRKYSAVVYPNRTRHALSGLMPLSLLRNELPVNRHTPMPFWGYDFKSVTPYAGFQHQAIITGIAGAMAYAMLNSLSDQDYNNTQTFLFTSCHGSRASLRATFATHVGICSRTHDFVHDRVHQRCGRPDTAGEDRPQQKIVHQLHNRRGVPILRVQAHV